MVLIIVLWYVRGRDPHAGPVASYLERPPDDLPPGAVGTLLDEHADDHDVTATLIGLARDGAVEIVELPANGGRDFELVLVHPERIASRLERDLLAVLFGPSVEPGTRVRLSQVRGAFTGHREQIRRDLYREMVDRGYFTRSPEATRRRWRRISWAGVIVSAVGSVLLMMVTDAWALEPAIASVIIWLVMLRMSRQMPQKTRHGAESAAKWRAFRTWLRDIRKHESLEANPGLFDRYLAYAVAFNLEKQWVREFERAGAPVPRWYHPGGDILVLGEFGDLIGGAGHIGHAGGALGDVGDINLPDIGGLPNVDLPGVGEGLQGASELMGSGLQGASDGLVDLLDSAGSIFDAFDFDW
jgi:hypothetical protein